VLVGVGGRERESFSHFSHLLPDSLPLLTSLLSVIIPFSLYLALSRHGKGQRVK
jgi:hypothetical protein